MREQRRTTIDFNFSDSQTRAKVADLKPYDLADLRSLAVIALQASKMLGVDIQRGGATADSTGFYEAWSFVVHGTPDMDVTEYGDAFRNYLAGKMEVNGSGFRSEVQAAIGSLMLGLWVANDAIQARDAAELRANEAYKIRDAMQAERDEAVRFRDRFAAAWKAADAAIVGVHLTLAGGKGNRLRKFLARFATKHPDAMLEYDAAIQRDNQREDGVFELNTWIAKYDPATTEDDDASMWDDPSIDFE